MYPPRVSVIGPPSGRNRPEANGANTPSRPFEAQKGSRMPTANPRRWTALAVIALAQFMVIMDTSIIGVALPEIQAGPWLHARLPVVGLQRVRRRSRRPPAARWPALRPTRRKAGLHRRLDRPGRRLARGGSGRDDRRRDRRSRRSRRWCRADRPVSSDAADDALRLQPEGAHQGLRRLRRGRTGRRHRRRLPRRRDHRVGQLAVGVLHQHPDRAARPRDHTEADAVRSRPPRVDRHRSAP